MSPITFFDVAPMTFADPIFIVPSTEVHKHTSPKLRGDRWTFNFGASLDPESRDHWHPYGVPIHEAGPPVVQIIKSQKVGLGQRPLPAELAALTDLVFVSPAGADK